MLQLDINKNVIYRKASLRYFNQGEYHCTRECADDVLFMVFEGTLNIRDDGVDYEIKPGEYHITKKGTYQEGKMPSESPKYLYVHFFGEWTEEEGILPDGIFNIENLMPVMKDIDKLNHNRDPLIFQTAKFYEILSALFKKNRNLTTADQIAEFIAKEYKNGLKLETLSAEFNFSKNHIINIFKRKYNMTPFEYLNKVRIKQAERLLEITSFNIEEIAEKCGFNNYSHFYRLFKAENNISPFEWRNQKRILP